MKAQTPDDQDSSLKELLKEWSVESSLPRNFNEQVWHRIANEETSTGIFELISRWITQVAVRPKFALGYAAALLVAGLLAGYWRANVASERADVDLGTRYVQMIDPYQMPRH